MRPARFGSRLPDTGIQEASPHCFATFPRRARGSAAAPHTRSGGESVLGVIRSYVFSGVLRGLRRTSTRSLLRERPGRNQIAPEAPHPRPSPPNRRRIPKCGVTRPRCRKRCPVDSSHSRRRVARAISRFASFSAFDCRLSYSAFPRPTASSSLAREPEK